MYSNGIIHRDIKCNNILLDIDNNYNITNFNFNLSSILANLIEEDNIGKKFASSNDFRLNEACKILLHKEQNNNERQENNETWYSDF